MIDRDRWQRVSALIDEGWALEPEARAAWLAALAAREPDLAPRVARALAEEADATSQTLGGFAGALASALNVKPPAADLTGLLLGNWRLEAKLGEGGMGQVWRAKRDDGLFQGEAAIKLLRGDLGSTALAHRFARERALLARLHHRNIARLLDAGIAGPNAGAATGQAYLVLELAQGDVLNAHVRRHAPTLAARVRLLARVAEAVAYAHARLVVHRDLKPTNILVTPEGAPKLLDFGIAALLDDDSDGELTRITGRGLTPGYAAPEQVTGAAIGTAADVFSLGVMLYELASGALPFGPRTRSRTALEHALLHEEPPRLGAITAAPGPDDPMGPGRPVDAAAARGDIEAIAAKALRKDPAERYGSVAEFAADLQAWLGRRPVKARRGNWRYTARLWVARNALLAAGIGAVALALGGALGASLWQRERAVEAARQAQEVTSYLEELLASASPDQHGGNWPTVLQLLEKSRADLPTRFADSPDTRLRVLHVLVETYRRLNRLDVAVPLGQQLVRETRERYGPADVRTLAAIYELTQSHQLQGQCDLAIAVLEPALVHYRALPAALQTEHTLPAVALSAICHARLGRVDEAERLLEEERRLVQALPADDPWHMGYLNHLHVLRVAQGRPREALDAIRRTQPFWSNAEAANQREVLTMQRNYLAAQIRVAEYERVEERMAELIARTDRLLGSGSNLGLSLRNELANYRRDSGDLAGALRQREATLADAAAAGIRLPSVLLPLRAHLLAARAAARAAPPAALAAEARALLGAVAPVAAELGSQRAEVWLAVARTGLAEDDAALAAAALDAMAADAGLGLAPGPAQDPLLAARKRQLDGQLARLRGDLATSRRLLTEHLAFLGRGDESRLVPAWSAALDVAATAILQGAGDASALLAHAATRRPASVPAGHPLDAAADYLKARLAAGTDDAPAVREALATMRRAQQRGLAAPALPLEQGALRGSLGGVLF